MISSILSGITGIKNNALEELKGASGSLMSKILFPLEILKNDRSGGLLHKVLGDEERLGLTDALIDNFIGDSKFAEGLEESTFFGVNRMDCVDLFHEIEAGSSHPTLLRLGDKLCNVGFDGPTDGDLITRFTLSMSLLPSYDFENLVKSGLMFANDLGLSGAYAISIEEMQTALREFMPAGSDFDLDQYFELSTKVGSAASWEEPLIEQLSAFLTLANQLDRVRKAIDSIIGVNNPVVNYQTAATILRSYSDIKSKIGQRFTIPATNPSWLQNSSAFLDPDLQGALAQIRRALKPIEVVSSSVGPVIRFTERIVTPLEFMHILLAADLRLNWDESPKEILEAIEGGLSFFSRIDIGGINNCYRGHCPGKALKQIISEAQNMVQSADFKVHDSVAAPEVLKSEVWGTW